MERGTRPPLLVFRVSVPAAGRAPGGGRRRPRRWPAPPADPRGVSSVRRLLARTVPACRLPRGVRGGRSAARLLFPTPSRSPGRGRDATRGAVSRGARVARAAVLCRRGRRRGAARAGGSPPGCPPRGGRVPSAAPAASPPPPPPPPPDGPPWTAFRRRGWVALWSSRPAGVGVGSRRLAVGAPPPRGRVRSSRPPLSRYLARSGAEV